jgi:hypothetical protein
MKIMATHARAAGRVRNIDAAGAAASSDPEGFTPNAMPGSEAEIEIRPLYEADDFAAADPTGELRKKERELREEIESCPG